MKISTIIPTFNEFEELERCVASLRSQETKAEIEILIVNAGSPLPPEFASIVEELRVADTCFWTGSVDAGLSVVADRQADFVLLLNADTELLPGSLEKLLDQVVNDPKIIACSPAYTSDGAGGVHLLYSDDVMMPFFLHNYLKRGWKSPEEAPAETYQISSIGGQGVLFSGTLIQELRMDPKRFPHYRGDQDFWLGAQKRGYRLVMVPSAGILNNRPFGAGTLTRRERLKKIPYMLSSPRARDSYRTIWNLHHKHQSLPVAILSFAIYFPSMVVYRLLQLTKSRVA